MVHIKGTKKEFEALADFILHDYLGDKYNSPCPLDIQKFAMDYLNMMIQYKAFPEKQRIAGARCGNYIYLDRALSCPEHLGARNFTIAHECAHELINCQDDRYNRLQLVNCRSKDSHKQLVTDEDFCEWQANVVASCLLMRPCLVDWTLYTFTCGKEKITVYGSIDYPCMYFSASEAMYNMANFIGVSQTALRIRMQELGLIEVRPYSEFNTLVPRLHSERRCR